MNRGDILFVGLGGAGGRLVDDLIAQDGRFKGFFINTSIGDINSLENKNTTVPNYYCISTLNGVGRNRIIGKSLAEENGSNMLDILMRHQQNIVYLVTSLGGGSGSSILSVLLEGIKNLKDSGIELNKTINVIGIIPHLDSPDVILNNSLETWDELVSNDCVDGLIFIDNNSNIDEDENEDVDREGLINQNFVELFDSIFDIPDNNSIKFDNGNLGNILRDKGCLYIYDIPNGCTSIEVAMSKSESKSVLAKMYKQGLPDKKDNSNPYIKCGYLGISFQNESYNQNYFYQRFRFKKEDYTGMNVDRNLLLISGCKPPVNSMKLIEHEIDDREKGENEDYKFDNSSFTINKKNTSGFSSNTNNSQKENNNTTTMKQVLKKNIFKKKK